MKESYELVDVGAPFLIPKENLNGPMGMMMKELEKKNFAVKSSTTLHPDFKPGYTTKGLEGDWQCTTVK